MLDNIARVIGRPAIGLDAMEKVTGDARFAFDLQLPGMLHAKTVLADDAVCAVGSANFDMRSLFLDYEISLFFTGAAETAFMAAWFEKTISGGASGPPLAGALRSGLESVACLLAPLL